MKTADNRTKAMLWLTNSKGISLSKARNIFTLFDAEELYTSLEKHRTEIVGAFGEKTYEALNSSRDDKLYSDLFWTCKNQGVELLTLYDEAYPLRLKDKGEPPLLLYAKGDLGLLSNENAIGVVGSRDLSRYGKEITEKFTRGLVAAGFTIVSGLARGADSEAHRTALSERGKTIGILGCGIDKIYPAENRELYERMYREGLVLTEYPLGTRPNAYQFPERNRIIAALSCGVLVTEARENSGSIITAEKAVDYDRTLYVVPQNVNSKFGKGSNALIKKYRTSAVFDVNDILEDLNMANIKIEEPSAMQLDFNEQLILNELERGDLHFDDLLEKTTLNVAELSSLLSTMELFGLIKKTGNNIFGV